VEHCLLGLALYNDGFKQNKMKGKSAEDFVG